MARANMPWPLVLVSVFLLTGSEARSQLAACGLVSVSSLREVAID